MFNVYIFWLIIETQPVCFPLLLEQDVINYTNFMKYLTKEDRRQLLKFLPPVDSLTPPERFTYSCLKFHYYKL
jgi:hypothetical protein